MAVLERFNCICKLILAAKKPDEIKQDWFVQKLGLRRLLRLNAIQACAEPHFPTLSRKKTKRNSARRVVVFRAWLKRPLADILVSYNHSNKRILRTVPVPWDICALTLDLTSHKGRTIRKLMWEGEGERLQKNIWHIYFKYIHALA